MINFLEFCLRTDPTQPSQIPQSLVQNGANLEFTYTRAKAAVLDEVVFTVEWIDDLTQTNWSATGVSETILTDDSVTQQVKATLPAGTNGRRFVRVRMGN
jgi:aspartate oxidase